ncbi:MAG: T9SS type A sorting domain-containing protein, partial [Chitinophagaceae bacterium]|nr:T9SS type A sorting domain-containing protein [Chitinophagaceae bacterium]
MKKNKITLAVLAILLASSNIQSNAQNYIDSNNNGLIEVYYIEQLDSMRYNSTGTCSGSICNGYELMRNLDFRNSTSYRNYESYISRTNDSSFYRMNRGWNPIGTGIVLADDVEGNNTYNALFEGNTYTIDNLYINRSSDDIVGLFGYVDTSCIIRNIGLRNVSVSGNNYVGGLVALNSVGIISESYAMGYVSGIDGVGVLVGYNNGQIHLSYATGFVSGSKYTGGLVGYNIGTINQSYATASVFGTTSSIGGLVGDNHMGRISQSYATGSVSGKSIYGLGGLVGYSNGGLIAESYATGSVSGTGDSRFIGGLVGYVFNGMDTGGETIVTRISQCYATGSVSGYSNVGGLIGSNWDGGNNIYVPIFNIIVRGVINQSYATGSVSGYSNVGGLIGYNNGYVHHGYWNKNAIQTVEGNPRSSNDKVEIGKIGTNSAIYYISGLTLAALQSPTGLGTDSIQELGPGFTYRQGFFPVLHRGARITINNTSFTQTTPSITNIGTNNVITNIMQGTVSTRATLNLDGIHFTANIIEPTNITSNDFLTETVDGTGSGIIGKYHITVNFTYPGIKRYDDAPFRLEATTLEGIPVLFSSASTLININNNTVTINGSGTVNITAYTENDTLFGFTNQILTIHRAAHGISFGALNTRTFGNAPFVLQATHSTSLPVVFSASNTLISISRDTALIKGAGTVNITAYREDDIAFDFITQILTIHRANQSVSFKALSTKTFGNAPFVLQATSSADLPIIFLTSNTLVSIRDNTVSINGVGMVNITAYQVGNENYLQAYEIQTLTIREPNDPRKINPSLTFTAIPTLTIAQKYVLTAISNSHGVITFISSDDKIVTVKGNTITAARTGTAFIIASQEANIEFNSAIAQQTVTVVDIRYINPLTFIERKKPATSIYPNPANDYITIQTDKNQKISSVKVYDIAGRIYELKVKSYELDIKTLPKGEYIIIIYGEKGEVLKTEKIMK